MSARSRGALSDSHAQRLSATGPWGLWRRRAAASVSTRPGRSGPAIDKSSPLRSSAPLEEAHAMIRKVAPHLDGDRYLALDIEAVTPLVRNGAFGSITASFPA